jgi:hypothetical protein
VHDGEHVNQGHLQPILVEYVTSVRQGRATQGNAIDWLGELGLHKSQTC